MIVELIVIIVKFVHNGEYLVSIEIIIVIIFITQFNNLSEQLLKRFKMAEFPSKSVFSQRSNHPINLFPPVVVIQNFAKTFRKMIRLIRNVYLRDAYGFGFNKICPFEITRISFVVRSLLCIIFIIIFPHISFVERVLGVNK